MRGMSPPHLTIGVLFFFANYQRKYDRTINIITGENKSHYELLFGKILFSFSYWFDVTFYFAFICIAIFLRALFYLGVRLKMFREINHVIQRIEIKRKSKESLN